LLDPADVKQALAFRLRELRRAKAWSQEKLAENADMHRTYLAGIERALRNPALENLVKLANALGVTMAELFTPDASSDSVKTHVKPTSGGTKESLTKAPRRSPSRRFGGKNR
jgi:transcriptional regulator with XRE-family HTH domain